MYCVTMKTGTKKYILATWTGGSETCIRLAEALFHSYGIRGNVEWLDIVLKQKMFAGYTSKCKHLTDSVEYADDMFNIEHLKFYIGRKTKEEILLDNPDYIVYFNEKSYMLD